MKKRTGKKRAPGATGGIGPTSNRSSPEAWLSQIQWLGLRSQRFRHYDRASLRATSLTGMMKSAQAIRSPKPEDDE